ncbi:hypothetical protein DFJ74DRAFT_770267 [Hyaloraphidium curvatum]|nr:hypothetical protein DFJ74DRAFT_770267 [Hyaloraphidium curvatum]
MSLEEDAAKPDASGGPDARGQRHFQPLMADEMAALLPLKPPPPPPSFFAERGDDASDDLEKLLRPPDTAAGARAADPGLGVLAPFPGLELFTRAQAAVMSFFALFIVPILWSCAAGVAASLGVALVFLLPDGTPPQSLAVGFIFPVAHILLAGFLNAQVFVAIGFPWAAALFWPCSRDLVPTKLAFAQGPLFADSDTWSNAWSGAIVALTLCATAALALCRVPHLTVTSSVILATSRLRHRAIALCLECTLRSCADVLRGGPGIDGADEYALLGTRLWEQVRANVGYASIHPRNIARLMPPLLLYGVVNAIVGRCVPAWIVVYLAWYLLTLFQELWVAALTNAEAADSASQYAEAASALKQLLLAAHPATGPTAAPAAVEHVRAHAAELETLAGSAADGGRKARILGFEITFGSIRTLYATIATVAFALFQKDFDACIGSALGEMKKIWGITARTITN